MRKKLFELVILFNFVAFPFLANAQSVMEPQWSEFCPPLYENAVYKQTEDGNKKYTENNYWALRRVKFEKSVMECKVISKTQQELFSCYGRVANIEKNKTAQRRIARQE